MSSKAIIWTLSIILSGMIFIVVLVLTGIIDLPKKVVKKVNQMPSLNKLRIESDLPVLGQNQNPMAVIKTDIDWQGEKDSLNSFEAFDDIRDGIRAGITNLVNKYNKGQWRTYRQMFTGQGSYAPNEHSPINNENAYLSKVMKDMGAASPDEDIFGKAKSIFESPQRRLKKLVRSIMEQELSKNRANLITDEIIEQAFNRLKTHHKKQFSIA